MLVFSQAETDAFNASADKSERDEQNSVNRRVVVLLFEPGTVVPPDRWPCPRTNESTSGCCRRFWSDANTRRNPQAVRRAFEDTDDTFACRFYHRLTVDSPCECQNGGKSWISIQLLDSNHEPRPSAPYKLTIGGKSYDELADSEGRFVKTVSGVTTTALLETSALKYQLTLQPLRPVTDLQGMQLRLTNLGYSCGEANGQMNDETHASLLAFQQLHQLPETGLNDAATQNTVKSIYGS